MSRHIDVITIYKSPCIKNLIVLAGETAEVSLPKHLQLQVTQLQFSLADRSERNFVKDYVSINFIHKTAKRGIE